MSSDRRSAELLWVIAEMIGTDPTSLDAWRGGRFASDGDATATERHQAILLFRLIQAYRVLPDGASRLRALRYVEELAAAQPIPAV